MCGAGEVGICYALMFTVYISSTSVIVINQPASASTDHSHSEKDTDPYFKSQVNVEDLCHWKPVLLLLNGLSKPGEQAHDRNWFLPWLGFQPTDSWSTGQCITAELSLLFKNSFISIIKFLVFLHYTLSWVDIVITSGAWIIWWCNG